MTITCRQRKEIADIAFSVIRRQSLSVASSVKRKAQSCEMLEKAFQLAYLHSPISYMLRDELFLFTVSVGCYLYPSKGKFGNERNLVSYSDRNPTPGYD